MSTRRVSVVSFVTAMLGVALLSTAWACTGQPQVFSVSPLAATAGSEVTMRGDAVAPGTAVELRWNAVAGPKLAETTADEAGQFAMSFAVPADAEPGVYSLMAIAGEGDADAGVGRTAFEVAADPQAGDEGQASAPSGFAADQPTSLHTADQTGMTPALAAGVALLSVGAIALFGGFAVATAQRRRALAVRPTRR